MSSDAEPRLQELVLRRIPSQVTHAVNALAVVKAIGTRNESLKETEFNHLFGSLQNFLVAPLILTTCNLFERPSKRNPTFSIPTAQQYLRSACQEPPFVARSARGIEILIREKLKLPVPTNAIDAAETVCAHFEQACPRYNNPRLSHPLDDFLKKLREQRDKRVAHLEDNLVGPSTDVSGLIRLLEFASHFANSIGQAFFENSNILPSRLDIGKSKAGVQMTKLIDKVASVADVRDLG